MRRYVVKDIILQISDSASKSQLSVGQKQSSCLKHGVLIEVWNGDCFSNQYLIRGSQWRWRTGGGG